jgi:hypothetical protein
MTMRGQARRSCAPLATSFFLSLILVLLFTLPSLLAQAEPAAPGASAAATLHPGDMNTGAFLLQSGSLPALKVPHDLNQRLAILALVLGFLSALTFILWRYHRRDYASPRRIGRRI